MTGCAKIFCLFTERGACEFFFPVIEQINRSLQHLDWIVFLTKDVLEYATAVHSDLLTNRVNLRCLNDNFLDAEVFRDSSIAGFISSASSKKNEFLFAQFALQNNIPIIHIIDTFYGYQRRFTTELGEVSYQNVALIDEVSRKEAIADGLNADLLFVTGHPGWERLQQSSMVSNANRKTVFFGAPIRKDYGNTLGFDEDDAWKVVTQVKRNTFGVIDDLVYCPHPQQTELPDLLGFPSVSYKLDMLQDFGQALGIFSAPLIHSFIAGGFPVSVQPGSRVEDWCAFSRRGIIMRAQSCEDLTKLLVERRARPTRVLFKILNRSAERFKSEICRKMQLR